MLLGMKRVVLVFLLASVAAAAFAQMDMLPQVFRDLPPELQQGLPEEMSYAEYRQLNRNVDFFTMFMSMIVPGYGLFQVERPAGAWSIVAARGVGYGLMATAVFRQWNDFRDLARRLEIPDTDYQFLLTNAFLFGGGVVINGFGWAVDVLLAYHIAKNERDFVQYKYGIEATVRTAYAAGSDPERAARALSRLIAQSEDRAVAEELLHELPVFLAAYPDHPFSADASFHLGLLLHARGEDARALVRLLRVSYRFPESELADDAIRLAIQITELNRSAWGPITEQLYLIIEEAKVVVPGQTSTWRALRAAGFVEAIAALPPDFRWQQQVQDSFSHAALVEAREFVRDYPRHAALPATLLLIAEQLVLQGQPAEASSYLALIVTAYPAAEVWEQAALRLGQLHLEQLKDERRARIVLIAVIERSPQSDEAATARELLAELEAAAAL